MYYSLDGDDGIEKMVGEGQILLIAPRHPNKGVQTKERVTWKDALSDINIDLEAGKWGTGPRAGCRRGRSPHVLLLRVLPLSTLPVNLGVVLPVFSRP